MEELDKLQLTYIRYGLYSSLLGWRYVVFMLKCSSVMQQREVRGEDWVCLNEEGTGKGEEQSIFLISSGQSVSQQSGY